MVPLFQALTTSETLMHRVAAEPLGTFAHPWPQAKSWPSKATWQQAQEIVRLSEGYLLYAAPGDPFLSRCAEQLQAYADNIERQQPRAPVAPLVVDPANPFGEPLAALLATLPDWSDKPSEFTRQAEPS